MAAKPLPAPELLRQLLRYDPDTGKLFWRNRCLELFSDGKQSAEHNCSIWNARYANSPALNCLDGDGYCHGRILGERYEAHRIIWAMNYGDPHNFEIDHINGKRSDNRLENLRLVTRAENNRNMRLRKDSPHGLTGIKQHNNGRWRAVISFERKRIHLGYYPTREEAVAARKKAEVEFGFHINHGSSYHRDNVKRC